MRRISTLILSTVLATSLGLHSAAPAKKPKPTKQAKQVPLTEQQKAWHVLNRLAFGPRPGDVERVMAMGVQKWIDQQLEPEKIDDKALDARLGPYRTLRMKPQDLVQSFPPAPMIQAVADGRRPQPADPQQRLIYAVAQARLKGQKPAGDAAENMMSGSSEKDRQEEARELAERFLAKPRNERMAAMVETPPEKLANFNNLILPDQRNRLDSEFNPVERETFRALANPTGVVASELQHGKILRAAMGERQLQEVMTDFWFNHFNVFLFKEASPYFITSYERDVIRAHALGKFKDLLVATAHAPAMLIYLDNWQSTGPDSQAGRNSKRGLNENYARELMELHTLGVDGGYTQQDVIAVANVLSGWTINQPYMLGDFQFDPRRHQPGAKTVMGQVFQEGGEAEGMRVLDMLARHPSTAHFVSKKLAQRFLADDPPEELVQRMADTFLKTEGDIREVLRTLFSSPEFFAPQYYRNKAKTPFEFVLSAVRASGAELTAPDPVLNALQQLGMPPYGQTVPTGYPEQTARWITPGALLQRINFVTGLSNGRFPLLRFEPSRLIALSIMGSTDLAKERAWLAPPKNKKDAKNQQQLTGRDLAVLLLEDAVFAGEVSPQTDAEIRKQLAEANPAADGLKAIVALALGSPEFQQR